MSTQATPRPKPLDPEKALEREFRASLPENMSSQAKLQAVREWRAQRIAEKQGQLSAPQPATSPEPQSAAVAAQDSPEEPARPHIPPPGDLTWLRCPLEGYSHVEVGYNLSARWDAVYSNDVENSDGLGILRRLMAIAPDFRGWDFWNELANKPYPKPVYGVLESYYDLARRMWPLGKWIVGAGLDAAIEESLKN